MSLSINVSALAAPLVDFITGKIIEAGTNGDAAKQAARATELQAINNALVKINNGDTSGLTDLTAAINTSALSPGEALALQSFLASAGKQLALIQSVAGTTLIGQTATAIATGLLSAANNVAAAYIAKAPAAAPAAAAPAPK